MAASAAATVKIKIANIWPVKSCVKIEKENQVEYFPPSLLPIKANYDAHQLLVNHIKNKVENVK